MTRLEINLAGAPQPAQEPFFCANTRHIAYGGARGGGKSWAMRRKFTLLALRYPGLRLLLLRRTLPELRENHILPLLAELARFCRYSDDEKAFAFPNGSRLKLGYCDSERDVYQYQGQEYDVVGFEEATHFTKSQVDFILTSNRSTRKDFKPRAYYTANPGNVGHAWFKRLFIDRQYEGTERPEHYQFFRARIYDNPALLDANPEYLTTLQNLPEDLRRAHLEGDWDVFAGQVFKEFRRDLHVCQPFPIPDWWKRFISNDVGFNDLGTWFWHAIDGDGRVWTYREAVFRHTTAYDQANEVKRRSGTEKIGYCVTGHDAGRRSVDTQQTAADYYARALQVPILRPPMTGESPRYERMMVTHEYLRPYTVPATDVEPARTEAKVTIFESCPRIIQAIPMLVYDETKTDQVDRMEGTESHQYIDLYDGWSYGIATYHARRSVEPKKPKYEKGTAGHVLRHAEIWEPEEKDVFARAK